LYVQSVIKALHKAKRPALFIKLDISKAFDSFSWSFSTRNIASVRVWQEMAGLDCDPASDIILQDPSQWCPGRRIKHTRGLQQGDPLSPMLFVLAMDPLHCLIELAANRGLLHPILPRAARLRCSLYGDDAALFANPTRTELRFITEILNLFGNCSGLKVNLNKKQNFPIRCDEMLVAEALTDFPGQVAFFRENT
jgi:hypothetical protein